MRATETPLIGAHFSFRSKLSYFARVTAYAEVDRLTESAFRAPLHLTVPANWTRSWFSSIETQRNRGGEVPSGEVQTSQINSSPQNVVTLSEEDRMFKSTCHRFGAISLLSLAISASAAVPGAVDRGPVDPETPISITIALSLPNLSEAERLQQAIYTPGDPQFHHFLTAEEFVARFAPSSADIAKIAAALARYGLTAEKTTATTLKVTGLPAQFERAFAVNLHRFDVDIATTALRLQLSRSRSAVRSFPRKLARRSRPSWGLIAVPPRIRIFAGFPRSLPAYCRPSPTPALATRSALSPSWISPTITTSILCINAA